MIRHGGTSVGAIAILVVCAAAAAQAQAPATPSDRPIPIPVLVLPFHSQDSGSFITSGTPIDTNGDGRTADLVLTSGQSDRLGAITTQSVIEWSIVFGGFICPQGDLGNAGTLVIGGFVIRAENGDLLRGRFDSGLMCFDTPGNTASIDLVGTITGGTGQFANARGTVKVAGVMTPVIPLVNDPINQQFGSVVLQTDGKIFLGPICETPPCPL